MPLVLSCEWTGGIPAAKVLGRTGGALPGPGQRRGGRRAHEAKAQPQRTKAPPAEPGSPVPLPRATPAGSTERGPGAALGGRSEAGAPGTLGARAPWPQITGARPPWARPGSPPAPWNAITGRASGPRGRGGARRGPPGRATAGAFPRGGPRLREAFSRIARGGSSAGAVPLGAGAKGMPALSRPKKKAVVHARESPPCDQGRTGDGLFSNVS